MVMKVVSTDRGLMLEGASAHLLRELLGALTDELRAQGVEVDRDLNTGLPRDQVRDSFASAGLHLPEDAIEWFGWRNGLTSDARREKRNDPLPHFFSWTLDEALSTRRQLGKAGLIGDDEWQWNPAWLHLIADNNGVAMHLGDLSMPPTVRSLSFGEPNTDASYTDRQVVSLCTPVYWWLEDLRSGVFTWDRDLAEWRRDWAAIPLERRLLGFG